MTWVLLLVVCSVLSDARTCEDHVLAHRLGEAECHAMVTPLSAKGQIAECVYEAHDATEEPEEARSGKRQRTPGWRQ